MFVMVFVVEIINIFCNGFILFIFFSRDISLYQDIQWYNPSLVPPQKESVHDAPDTTIQNYLSNK